MSSKLKNLFLLVVIIGIAYFGYNYFIKKDTPQAGLVSSSTQTASSATGSSELGKEFLTLLLNLKVITLDDSIIKTEPYQRLIDFTKVLSPDTNPGRPNPFAPIGTEGAVPVTPTSNTPQPTLSPVQNGNNASNSGTVETVTASSIQSVSAVLNGVLPQAVSGTLVWFEYGTNSSGLTTSTSRLAQNTSGTFSMTVSGLRANTTYYFRAVAQIGGKTVTGQTLSFKIK